MILKACCHALLCPARACQSRCTPHLPGLLRYQRKSSIWTCLCVLGRPYPPIAGDEAPSLALCRREIQSSHPCLSCPVLQPSSPALQSSPAQKGEKLAATAAAVNLAQIHLISPSCTPRPRQPRLAGLRSTECFNSHQTAQIAVRAGGSVNALCFSGPGRWGRREMIPHHLNGGGPGGRGYPCRCSFPSTSSSGLRPKPLAIYTSDCGLR